MVRQDKNGELVAIVTGAGSGIGLATTRLLLERGWCVAALDLHHAESLTELEAGQADGRLVVCACDVSDEAQVAVIVNNIATRFGRIDGVVNSAGMAADKHVFDTSAELFRKILDVNVVGTFLLGREAARHMAKVGSGAIVNVASISGLRGSKGRSAYGASKGAVVNLTQVMANDLAPHGIRVNAVAPGPVETPMVKALHTVADRELYNRYIPMRRYAEPSEIASVIHFLLDVTQSSFVTGEIIAVDGGYRGAGIIVDPA